ncbi:MAG: 50S ribosomal protein L6 [Chloroflexi bacterium]|nr:50S ribosomal protein L6 [Chloroflexota bacterium]
MSRIGRMPIPVPAGVEVKIEDRHVLVSGKKGQLSHRVPEGITVERSGDNLIVARANDSGEQRSLHGLTRSLIANMVKGVTEGYRKQLEISGVGYRAAKEGDDLVLQLGFSHPVRLAPPAGIQYAVDTPTRLAVEGIDKELVGEYAARIRALRKAEPYKGKGITYTGERIRRKAGKAGKIGGKK